MDKNTTAIVVAILGTVGSLSSAYFIGNRGAEDQLNSASEKVQKVNESALHMYNLVTNTEARVSDALRRIEQAEPILVTKKLDRKFRVSDDDKEWLARVFIETGVDSPYVLATFKDNKYLGHTNLTLWASARTWNKKKGILLTVVMDKSGSQPINEKYSLEVNVFQKNAREYGDPVLYDDS